MALKMQIIMILAPENFRDEEYKEPRDVFMASGFTVKVGSTRNDVVTGKFGLKVRPHHLIQDIDANQYDALVIVGGSGIKDLWNNTSLYQLARSFFEKEKIIGAICSAPIILAKAGLLKGRKATCYVGDQQELEQHDVHYVNTSIMVDYPYVTANGPKAASRFGLTVVEEIERKTK